MVETWILQKFDESNINLPDTRNQSSDFMALQTGAVKGHKVMIIDDDPSVLLARIKEITISKHAQPRTSSILLISIALGIAIILLMYAGIAYTEGMMKLNSTRRNKIIGYKQRGMYSSPQQFKLALSYCDTR